MNQALANATRKWVDWFQSQALPRWGGAAINPASGASYERFLANGEIDLNANLRMRVIPRQIYVFATAVSQGWLDRDVGRQLVDGLQSFLDARGQHPSGRGYIHIFTPDYAIADSKRDVYDHAFILLSCAARYKAFADDQALALADRTLQFLDDEFGHAGGGWLEGDYPAPWRRQNPHMHMFEACLAMFEASGQARWLARAGELFSLFETRFFDSGAGVLREFFNADWTLPDSDAADIIEPGHMMEWVWLLHTYARHSGRDLSRYTDAMYSKGIADGLMADGLMVDAVTPVGELLRADKRSWPMAELVKASLVQAQSGLAGAEDRAAAALEQLMASYISTEYPGLYVDQISADGSVASDLSQASTLYHLIACTAEAVKYCEAQY